MGAFTRDGAQNPRKISEQYDWKKINKNAV
jgi:hypothetical protein